MKDMAFVDLCSARLSLEMLEGQGYFDSSAAQGHRCDGL